jgi:hypothetical protein
MKIGKYYSTHPAMINTIFAFLMGIDFGGLALLIMIIWSVIYLFIGKNKILKWVMVIFLGTIVLLIGFVIVGIIFLEKANSMR